MSIDAIIAIGAWCVIAVLFLALVIHITYRVVIETLEERRRK
tara:strand:+ start:371 stop:496 length:126 start_codon:yes stop_codon:yes gene_type:complete